MHKFLLFKPGDSFHQIYYSEQAVQIALKNCKDISWTYNGPALRLEYTLDTAKFAKEQGFLTNHVTNDYIISDHRC